MAGAGARGGPVWTPAVLSEPLGGGRVRCTLCPHACELADGETGTCQVRRNQGGALHTATFAVSVEHLDAVERKPLYHFHPGSRVLTVAGPGCTFRCNYCVNHRLSQYGRVDGVSWTASPADPAALVGRAADAGAAVGLSYAEPGLAVELTLALGAAARPRAVPVLWKTNGFLTARAVDLVAGELAAVNVDVKAADDTAHRRLTGAPLRPVLDTVERLRAAGVWVEVSTPLVPGVCDTPAQLSRVAHHLAGLDPGIPWHLLRFTPDFRMRRPPPTGPDALAAARDAALAAGLRFVYVERALGDAGRQTRCPGCDDLLVERDVWRTRRNAVGADGACPRCATVLPGRWGPQRAGTPYADGVRVVASGTGA